MVGRVSLALHSLMDGLGIGFAFQVSQSTGWLVAAAVLAHDMADGANMIGISSTACRPHASCRSRKWTAASCASSATRAATTTSTSNASWAFEFKTRIPSIETFDENVAESLTDNVEENVAACVTFNDCAIVALPVIFRLRNFPHEDGVLEVTLKINSD